MTQKKEKGLWKRTLHIFTQFRIPWHLYVLQVILGIVSTKVALLYIPYLTNLQMGNIHEPGLVGGYLGYSLLKAVTSVAVHIPTFYATCIVSRNLQNRLTRHALHLPMRAYERSASNLVGWIMDGSAYADGLITSVVGFLTGAAAAWMSVTALPALETSMTVIVIVILVYVIFSTWVEGRLLFLRERREKKARAELTAYLAEHLSYFTQIKQLHAQQEELQRGKIAIEGYYKAELYQAVLTLLNNFVSGSVTDVINILVFVLGVPMVQGGRLSLTELAAFQNIILVAYNSLSSLPSLYTSFMSYNGRLFFVGQLMAEPEEVLKRSGGMDREDESIHFENVSFGYDPERPVLQNATFTIPKGKVTMVAGPNGSGKTTLFKLIERFYTPDSGKMTFGSTDAEQIHLDEWRQSFAYVLQEPQLFDGTIRDNIAFGMDRAVTDEEIFSAARLACADEFIRTLPEGYDFVIGDNGSRLSAGQRQRIAIARAVMLDPAYLLLDEATCNIDILAEKQVTEAMLRLMEGRTTVMISHDMRMLDRADQVVVLSGGTVEIAAPRAEAIASSPTLKKLIAAEAGKGETE